MYWRAAAAWFRFPSSTSVPPPAWSPGSAASRVRQAELKALRARRGLGQVGRGFEELELAIKGERCTHFRKRIEDDPIVAPRARACDRGLRKRPSDPAPAKHRPHVK